MYLRYENLENQLWTPVTGPSINPVASQGAAITEADGLRLYELGPAYGGILWKCPCVIPPLAPKGTATLSFNITTDDAAALMSQAQEFDIMIVGRKGEVYNDSEQLNNAEGGHWQNITTAYKWNDTGFNPGKFPANSVVPVSFEAHWDTVAGNSSVPKVTVGSQVSNIANPILVPVQQLNWDPNQIVIQIQMDESAIPGAYSEKLSQITLEVRW